MFAGLLEPARRDGRARCGTCGSTPATSAASTTTASCTSSTARRTRCAAGARTSRASRWRRRSHGHDAIRDVAVHAVPSDDGRGRREGHRACCSPAPSSPRRSCAGGSPSGCPYFAIPRYIEFRDDLPRNPVGRVLKYELRDEGVTAHDLGPRSARASRSTAAEPRWCTSSSVSIAVRCAARPGQTSRSGVVRCTGARRAASFIGLLAWLLVSAVITLVSCIVFLLPFLIMLALDALVGDRGRRVVDGVAACAPRQPFAVSSWPRRAA